jgi:hypothetical protein
MASRAMAQDAEDFPRWTFPAEEGLTFFEEDLVYLSYETPWAHISIALWCRQGEDNTRTLSKFTADYFKN